MIRMPWTDRTLPNAMIDVTDLCNTPCRVCFHRAGPHHRSMDRIRRDFEDAKRLRNLHTVTLSGGEPTLHPDLCDVVRMIKAEGFHVFLLTNGLLTDDAYLARLRQAGLDSVLFHVDPGQTRPDLPGQPSFEDVKARLNVLIAGAARVGLDVSISTTLYRWEQLPELADYFLRHPDVTFLSLSKAVDVAGFFGGRDTGRVADDGCLETAGLRRFVDFFRDRHALEPFSYIPTRNGRKAVWVSFFVPVLYHPGGYTAYPYRSTWIDAATMRLGRRLTRRYVHKTRQNTALTLLRIFLNAASRLRPGPAIGFWARSRRPGRYIRHKMIVYDDGPFWAEDGSMQHCACCPAAVVRNGAMRTSCTVDYAPEDCYRAAAS